MFNTIRNIFSPYYLYKGCNISKTAKIFPYCIIGLPPHPEDMQYLKEPLITKIGNNVYLSPFCVIYKGAILKDDVYLDPYVRVGSSSTIGEKTRLLYGARIHDNVSIGSNCQIGGNCSDDVIIGNNVTHFGRITHKYNNPKADWATTVEKSPVIENNAIIGANSYIGAGEIIRNTIPANHIFYKNKLYSSSEWKGSLSKNKFFKDENI